MNKPKIVIGGFYTHYKRNPQGDWDNYLYQVLNIGHHTEIQDANESSLVVYRPLYKSQFGTDWACRPLEMFMGYVDQDGIPMKRFTLVTDEWLLAMCNSFLMKEK